MAGITTTQTFSDGDTVTAAKLNNIVANASIDNGAITNAKLGTDAVTLTKMANNSVDTAELIDDAVANSKLATMEKRRVKVNATDATANPTDLFVDANELLVGTSNSINAVGFNTDLELDASNSTATLVRASDGLINGKSVATPVAANDSVLFYDANGTGNKLRKATVKSTIQSLDATSSESGVVSLATTAEIINPTTIVAAADAVGAAVGAPMMAKAWGYLKTASGVIVGASSILQNCSVTRTGDGAFTVAFTTALPSVKYMVLGNGRALGPSTYGNGLQLVSSSLAVGSFNFLVVDTHDDVGSPTDPDGGMQFVVYGLTS